MISSNQPRLGFGEALRKYWPFLLGLVLFQALAVFLPPALESTVATVTLFLVAAMAAAWPYLFGAAPFSFWIFACVYWIAGAVAMLLLKLALMALGVIPGGP